MTRIPLFHPRDLDSPFPPVDQALRDPNGLLAAGGSLSERRLLLAYRSGIFPWYSEGEPILWWSPDPRCVLWPEEIHVSRSLQRTLRRQPLQVRWDTAFEAVMQACAEPRPDQSGTWITAEMQQAYGRLHRSGYAHSIEVWRQDQLVGGLYGVRLGRVFFGESMFSRMDDASKVAMVQLAAREDIALIDCQLPSEHLLRMGARTLPRAEFIELLRRLVGPEGG